MLELNRTAFENYLRDRNYSEWTQSGHRSTVYDYPSRIDTICKDEGYVYANGSPDWYALMVNLDALIDEYDKGGVKSHLGAKSNNAPINALKRLREYFRENDVEISSERSKTGKPKDENVVSSLDRYVVKAIIERLANSNSPLTYGELANVVGEMRNRPIANQGFAYVLGRIQDYCLELRLPSLPVLVVDKTLKPAHGFATHYREIHPESKELTDNEIIRMERDACIACKDWQKLYDRVGLEESAPIIHDLIAEHENKPIYEEGERVAGVIRTEVKRNPAARTRCLALKGRRCIVCEKDLKKEYGVPGIIHVHHLKPIFETCGAREVDPEKDLVPVCPNCHAVIHSKGRREDDCYTPNAWTATAGELLGRSGIAATAYPGILFYTNGFAE